MYTNILDTVRTSGSEMLNIESMLYTSILSGLHPTLSLNQAVDNTALLALCHGHKDVVDLINNNYIRVATHKTFRDSRGHVIDPILGYILNNLTFPEEGSSRDPFIFSSLPFLYTGNYDEKALRAIYSRMKLVISDDISFKSNLQSDTALPFMDMDHVEQLDEYLQTVKIIICASNGKCLPPRANQLPNNRLSLRIIDQTRRIKDIHQKQNSEASGEITDEFVQGMNALGRHIASNLENGKLVDSRSHLRSKILEFGCEEHVQKELIDMVDLCYNEVVSASLCDDEQDLIAVENSNSNIDVLIRHNDPQCMASGQKLLLAERASTSIDELSWEKLTSVLKEANARHIDSVRWAEEMECILWNHEVKSLQAAGKYCLSGCFELAKSVLLSHDAIKSIISPTENVGMKIVAAITLLQNLQESIPRIADHLTQIETALRNRADYINMQELLSQTAYMKKDSDDEDSDA